MPRVFLNSHILRCYKKMVEAYCVKCKAKREMSEAKEVTMKNGRSAMKGKCPECTTGMYRIMGGAAKKKATKKK